MKYFLLYVIAPTVISFFAQSILCRRVKRGLLRHGTLLLSLFLSVMGAVILFTQSGGIFGGLSAIMALLWLAAACCCVLGYGLAWFLFLFMSKGRGRE